MDETLGLQWKTFPVHLERIFRNLREDSHFTDVTLVSDELIQIPAHRVILCACSPVLGKLLASNPNSHPLLYMRGIKQSELQALLNFMYLGEAQIPMNRVDNFLMVAKDLEIKEIHENEMEKDNTDDFIQDDKTNNENIFDEQHIKNEDLEHISDKIAASDETVQSMQSDSGPESNENSDITIMKPKTGKESFLSDLKNSKIDENQQEFNCIQCPSSFKLAIHLKRHERSKHPIEKSNGRFNCSECTRSFKTTGHARQHFKIIHAGLRPKCNECGALFISKGNLKIHKKAVHEGVKYPCTECSYQSTQLSALKTHIDNLHAGLRFPCNQCDSIFTYKGSLTSHIKEHHNGFVFTCHICDFKTTKKYQLQIHKRRIHFVENFLNIHK